MEIVFQEMSIEKVPTAKGSYDKATVTYRKDGKLEEKALMSFVSKVVIEKFKKAKKGDKFWITTEKNSNGYWQWIKAEESDGEDTPPFEGGIPVANKAPAAKPSGNGNWETKDERQARQVCIVRQSSLSNAIEFLNHNNKNYKLDDVIDTAKSFEAYVFGSDLSDVVAEGMKGDIMDIEEDIPQ